MGKENQVIVKAKLSIGLLLMFIILIGCNMCFAQESNEVQKRKQVVLERDSNGIIVKTYDGFVYRVLDKQGRLIEAWGNKKRPDMDDNFRTVIEITDSVVLAKEYFFEKKNTECKIVDSLDCYISKGYYENGGLLKIEYWNPVKDKNKKVNGHTLSETEDNPGKDNFISYLPSYLKR